MGYFIAGFIGIAIGATFGWFYWRDNVLGMRKQCHAVEKEICQLQGLPPPLQGFEIFYKETPHNRPAAGES